MDEKPLGFETLSNTTSPHFSRSRMIEDARAAGGAAQPNRRAQGDEERATHGGEGRLGWWSRARRFFSRALCAGVDAGGT